MNRTLYYLFVGACLYVLTIASKCSPEQVTATSPILNTTSEDSIKSALSILQEKMDSLLGGLTFAKDISSNGYQFDKLKQSVFILINYDSAKEEFNFGTACVVDSSGIAISNYHVISDYPEMFCIRPGDTSQIQVKVLEENRELDYVILKLDPINGPYIALSKALFMPREGADVFAIGHPEGLSFTLTKGIVSAYRDKDIYIQIDAAISSGNSGGPLLNNKGELIGINSFKYLEGENLNFALNINYIPYQKYINDSNNLGSEDYRIVSTNDKASPIINREPVGQFCIERALRAYSNAIIDFNPNLLLELCENGLNIFNGRKFVSAADIKDIVSEMEISSGDYKLHEKDLEWEKAKYSYEDNLMIGMLDGILSYEVKPGRMVVTHIQMIVKLNDECIFKEAQYSVINTF